MNDEQHLPWMKVWVYDFIGKTVMWSGVAGGLYAQCLILEWAHGPLPDDAATLASILKYDPATFATAWATVRPAFEATADGRLVNPALEAERADAYELRESRSGAARTAAEARWKHKANAPVNASGNASRTPSSNASGNASVMPSTSNSNSISTSTSNERVSASSRARARNPPEFRLTPERRACAIAAGLDPEATIKDFAERAKARRLPMTNTFFAEWCKVKAKQNAMDEPEQQSSKHLNGSGQDVPT